MRGPAGHIKMNRIQTQKKITWNPWLSARYFLTFLHISEQKKTRDLFELSTVCKITTLYSIKCRLLILRQDSLWQSLFEIISFKDVWRDRPISWLWWVKGQAPAQHCCLRFDSYSREAFWKFSRRFAEICQRDKTVTMNNDFRTIYCSFWVPWQ